MVKKIPFPATEEPEQQLITVKAMKKRHKDWLFNICPVCKTWCVVRPKWDGKHLICFEQTKKRSRKGINKNQESFI